MSLLTTLLHPLRATKALREIEQLRQQQAESDATLQQTLKLCNEQTEDAARLTSKLEEAERQLSLYRHKTDALQKRLDASNAHASELQHTLDEERAETDAEIAEIDKRLTAVDAMKQRYENRISHLNHALRDAKARLDNYAAYAPDAEMQVIDMETSAPLPESDKGSRFILPNGDSPEPSDWLMPLPDK